MKHKSKRAKATEIPQEVRERVYIRDGGKCIICGKQGIPNSHYIRRSQGGLRHRAEHCYNVPYLPPKLR